MDINWLYGYRTNRSMASNEAWIEGNRYSANVCIKTGIITLFSALIVSLLSPFDLNTTLISFIILSTLGLISVIPITERHLRKMFV